MSPIKKNTGIIDSTVNALIKNRLLVIVLISLITVIFGYGISKIVVNNDASKALPDDLPQVMNMRAIREKFNAPYSVIFMVQFENETITEKITLLNGWAEQFEAITINGELGVSSVSHLGKLKVPERGGMIGVRAVSLSPEQSSEKLIGQINENREITRNFISDDFSTAVMLIYTRTEVDRQATLSEVQNVLESIHDEGYKNTYITGATATAWYLNKGIRANFRQLLPVAILICAVILYTIFRRLSFVLAPLVIISIALLWVFGLLGFLHIDFTLLSSVIPVILFPIGLANSIHILKTYNHYRVKDHSFEESFTYAYQELMRAVILTSLTTFFGFASFAFSDLKWTQNFGIFTGLGVMIVLFLSVLLLPLLISPEKGNRKSDQSERLIPVQLFKRLVFETPTTWIFLMVIIIFITLFAPKVSFDNNPIHFFDRDHDVVLSDSIVNDQFGGTRFFDLLIESETPIDDSAHWADIFTISDSIGRYESVGSVISIVPVLRRTSQIVSNQDLSETGITLLFKTFARQMQKVFNSFITEDHCAIKMSLTLSNQNNENYIALSEEIKEYIETAYPHLTVTPGGQALLIDAGLNLLVKTQLVSLSITFIMVALILILLFRDIRLGIYTTIPIVLSSLTVAGVMALFNVTINTVTVIIINTSVGIGIDYAIHFTAGYLRQRQLCSTNREAIIKALKYKGAVIMFNTIAVGVGLLVLLFSNFPPIRELGLFIFVSMGISSAFSLLFLPLLLNTITDTILKTSAHE